MAAEVGTRTLDVPILARLHSHLTFANVVSLTALFVALSGGAYALSIPKNSVGAKQLKKNGVTSSKIKRDAVTSSKVKDGSLLGKDFKPGQLPAGLQGPKGDAGPKGDPGISGYQQVDDFSAFDSTTPKGAQALCPEGMTVIGGGATINGGSSVGLRNSVPQADGLGWIANAYETAADAGNWNVDARAICANVAP